MGLREKIEEVTGRYPKRRSAIMPALFFAQQEHGHLSGEVLLEVADILDVPEIWVYELATFYDMYHTEPVGKFHIHLCTNVSCLLLEADNLLAYLESKLGIERGDTTADGLFTLSTAECLGSCDTAPVMQVNDTNHENLSERRIDGILEKLRGAAGGSPGCEPAMVHRHVR
jgi:NADH-quinone oxidoreductase subunit E